MNAAPTLDHPRYRLDALIAVGGMGEVWSATDTLLEREVAVKVLKREHADDPVFRARFAAEAVEVTFDPERVSYEDLLDVFWKKHNPTTKNRQGLDIGSQYRSAIFFHSPEQEAAAIRTRDEQQAKLHWPRKIVTEIVPAPEFYEAEDYHQQYMEKQGRSSCTPELASSRAR